MKVISAWVGLLRLLFRMSVLHTAARQWVGAPQPGPVETSGVATIVKDLSYRG